MSTLTEAQLRLIENIVSLLIGSTATFGIQWIKERKPKTQGEVENEYLTTITKASGENIIAAGQVVDMLQKMLDEQTERFEKQIFFAEENCNAKIEKFKEEYVRLIEDLKSENEAFIIAVERFTKENLRLSIQVADISADREEQSARIKDIRERLSKYESVTTDELSKVAKKKLS